jgi:magnesium transporter
MIRSIIADGGLSPDDSSVKIRRNLGESSLTEAHLDGKPLWLDIVEPSQKELDWLESLLELHPTVIKDIGRRDHRPTLLVYPNYLFITLFEPQISQRQITAQEIHCIIGDNFFVTVRSGRDDEVNEAYNRVAQQNADAWRRGMSYILYLTTQYVIDAYYPILDQLSLSLDKLEEKVLLDEEPPPNIRQSIYQIKQQLIKLRQMVAPQREVLSSAIGAERLAGTDEHRDLFRHLYERLLRVYDVVDAQRDLSSNILDLVESHESTALTNAVSRLTIISMIFFPLTFVAAILELNLIVPQTQTTVPISGGMALLSLIASMVIVALSMAFFFRQRGWI